MIGAAILHCSRSDVRAENVRSLLKALPHASVIPDQGDAIGVRKIGNMERRGCWPLARHGWLAYDPRATHHLVLEDDAVLCDNFEHFVESVVRLQPGAIISLFHGPRDCTVATVMPVAFIPKIVEWADTAKHGSRFLPHHSHIIAQGSKELGLARSRTEPSLVDHGRFDSLLDHPHLVAYRFEQSPTSVSVES
jgi:hypothetical protein